jgi:transaldolase
MGNPLLELQKLGQSPWHDNIRRDLLTSGALARMVDDGDVTGLTSNPTIFEQAIAGGRDYDAQIHALARQGKSPNEIFDALAVKDISGAADVFAPVYTRTNGNDGFVSIEVAPRYANDTARTIDEAHRLWDTVGKPNLMVKIPGTAAGIPAIEECIADGLNINITLIFSLARYDAVMNAYLAGLERRLAAGKPIAGVASVASFFVSRVDTEVDKRLDALLAAAAPDQAEQLEQLKGKTAIANAKLAYVNFRRTFSSTRYVELAGRGANLQRPLWASTSTKNPAYPDLYYVEDLVGPDTVNTMPPATLAAYKDHGDPEIRIDRDLEGAAALMQRLADVGISIDEVTAKLEVDGVASFAKSYDTLITTVSAAARAAMGNGGVATPATSGGARAAGATAKPRTATKRREAATPRTAAKKRPTPRAAAKKRPTPKRRAAKRRATAKPRVTKRAAVRASRSRATSSRRAGVMKTRSKRNAGGAAAKRGAVAKRRARSTTGRRRVTKRATTRARVTTARRRTTGGRAVAKKPRRATHARAARRRTRR